MQEIIKANDICVECNPISNRMLGFTRDLRYHPTRFMLDRGIQVSISSDVPSFFYSEGVTLDFLMVVLAWELDLKDLKKLALNGLNYSSISEEKKANLRPIFDLRWQEFISLMLKTYGNDEMEKGEEWSTGSSSSDQ
jgi:adenosine deaminase